MTDQPIITAHPVMKEKGFRPDQLRIVPGTAQDSEVQARIGKAVAGNKTSLTADRQRVIDLFTAAYERKATGLALDPEHYVLEGHELVELDRIADSDLLRYLFYRYKYNMYPELKIADDYPPCLQIEPSSVCNFRCVMCYQTDDAFTQPKSGFMGYMALDVFKNIIDQAEGNIEAITLASRGEPLLNRHIADMLDYCRGKFLGLKVNTNASMLTERICHALLSSDVQTIVFSIDAADKELYERIRVRGHFDRLLENLDRFNDIKAKHYPDSQTITRISGVKINELQGIESMERQWADYADVIAFTNYTPWQSSYENAENDITEPCTELWRRMFVWQDGVANPCDYDYKSTLSKWTVADASVSEIWTSDGYNELRAHHLGGTRSEVEPCKRCISV